MNKVTAAVPTQALALSAEQWQGLARLADLVNALSGPLAGPVTGTLDPLLGLANRHDLGALSTDVVATIQALPQSGLLRLLRATSTLLPGCTALTICLLASSAAVAGQADIVGVNITPVDGSKRLYRFDVSVRHEDSGWDHYADR